ncbi:hypothetical protein ABZ714_22980 [Streptomyces sp. NPDC006798]|uniref:hypothetical protein n=1 Tax=Streptomyces sp. NPDC006798 TaxID=3155462 RepID=UPI0033FE1681
MLAIGTAALIAGGFITAAPAAADGQACWPSGCASSPAAGARFVSHGDIFYVRDYRADGKATAGMIEYYVPGEGWYRPGEWVVYNRNGYAGPPEKRNYEIAEGSQVRYMSCLVNGSTLDCTDWRYDRA